MRHVDLVVVESSKLKGLLTLKGPKGEDFQSLLRESEFQLGEKVTLMSTAHLKRLLTRVLMLTKPDIPAPKISRRRSRNLRGSGV